MYTHTLYGEYIYNHHKVNLKRENFFYPRSGISFLYSKIGTHSLWPGSRALQTCKLEEENFLLFNYARESRAFQSAGGLPYIKGSPSFCFMLKETKTKKPMWNFFLWVIFSTTSLKTAPWQYPPEVDGILERYFGFKMLIILKWCQNCSYLEERERERGESDRESWDEFRTRPSKEATHPNRSKMMTTRRGSRLIPSLWRSFISFHSILGVVVLSFFLFLEDSKNKHHNTQSHNRRLMIHKKEGNKQTGTPVRPIFKSAAMKKTTMSSSESSSSSSSSSSYRYILICLLETK